MEDVRKIIVAGVNFRTADIALREKLSLDGGGCERLVGELCGEAAEEAAVLSTCNRFELILGGVKCDNPNYFRNRILEILRKEFSLAGGAGEEEMYFHEERAALTHLFRVACGLDSMIIGEPQILGQLKASYEISKKSCGAGPLLNRAFHRAFHVAKTVRTHTSVGRHCVSFGSIGCDLAEQIYGDLSTRAMLLIGGGEMGRLLMRQFKACGCERFYVASRTLERACEVAEEVAGVALVTDKVQEVLARADIVVGAAALPLGVGPIVTSRMVRDCARQREFSPQLFIDLGVPRNFDSRIGELADFFLYNIDDFEGIARSNRALREEEVVAAEKFVLEEVEAYWRWLRIRRLTDSLKILGEAGAFREIEIGKAMKAMRRARLSDEVFLSIEQEIVGIVRDANEFGHEAAIMKERFKKILSFMLVT